MIDLAEAGPAVFILRKIAMVFDAKAADFGGACLDVSERIDVQIIHHVARVVIHFHSFVGYLADDFGTGGASARLAAVLFDDDHHAMIAGNRPELLESLHPELPVPPFGMSECEHLRDLCSRSL